ncbi:MAG: polysaccharide deacetylase family protein [Desulfuromonadaceae bacterium]|nr:polysaccharide deacetylase family protein [Desulfuromonadaceae bacterium]
MLNKYMHWFGHPFRCSFGEDKKKKSCVQISSGDVFALIMTALLIFIGAGTGSAQAQEHGLQHKKEDTQNSATIFVYHRFGDERYPSTNISVELFEQHLRYLRDNAYTVLPISEIVALLRRGETLPPRCVGLSADDAYASVLSGAVPLLDKYAMPMTLFVNSDSVGGGSYLTWEQLRQLDAKDNIEIGNHSATHPYFVSLPQHGSAAWRKQVEEDISSAQQAFVKHLGYSPQLFAYPYGEFSPELKEVVSDMGFTGALGQQSGPVGSTSPLFALPRFPMGGIYVSMERLRSNLSMTALDIDILQPETGLLSSATPAPELVFKINNPRLQVSTMKCYVQGQEPVKPQVVDAQERIYKVQAAAPLQGRRNKYTLTAQDSANRWYWFSQPWVQPEIKENYQE